MIVKATIKASAMPTITTIGTQAERRIGEYRTELRRLTIASQAPRGDDHTEFVSQDAGSIERFRLRLGAPRGRK
ncbi:MAG: hypothetical protein ACREA0_00800 [bacterium]